MELITTLTGKRGRSGFGSASTAEQVTAGIDATNLTAIVTGISIGHRSSMKLFITHICGLYKWLFIFLTKNPCQKKY